MSSTALSAAARAAKGASLVYVTSSVGSSLWTTECEQKKQSNVRTRMTSIGHFAHNSETMANPSVPTLFMALTGPKPMTASSFLQLWQARGVSVAHPRFEQCIDMDKPGHFINAKKPIQQRITDTLFPVVYRSDLALRMSHLLTQPLDVSSALWEARVTSGNVGISGAVSRLKTENLPEDHNTESLLLFRSHHALADGASLTAALLELCEEADEIKEMIKAEFQRRRRGTKSFLAKVRKWLLRCLWFCKGYIECLLYQMKLMWTMPVNPLELVLKLSGEEAQVGRNVSWCDAAPVDQVKQIARAHGPKVTINDVWVSCVSYAMAKQLEEHRERLTARGKTLPKFPTFNIVVPVHLGGGVLLPEQTIGNFIGAFGASIPGEVGIGEDRLSAVHKTLSWVKTSPAPLLGYLTARTSAILPVSWTKYLFRKASANACVSITNVRGSPKQLHMDGNTVQSIVGFLPLPPGVPVGVVITSYAGTMSLTVTGQPWAVPDADQFLMWMLDEYRRLLKESGIPE